MLLGGDQVVEMLRMLDVPAIEQVIAVPKISLDGVPQRSVLRRPQKAEQLVEVPTDPVYSRAVIAWGRRVAAAMAEQTVDYPVPQGRRGGGGLQGSRAGQNSTAADAEQIVDIPARSRGLQGLRPGQNSTALGGAVHVDIPVPSGRGGRVGWGGLQGFSQEQNSTASCGAELVDIPVPSGRGAGLHEFSPGQGSRASSSCSRAAEVAFDGVFRTFPGVKKSAEVAGQVSARVPPHSSSWTPAAYGHGTLPGGACGQGDFFQDGDEEEEEEELEMFDESIDRFELSGWRPRRLCCDYMAGCCARGWGCTFAHGEQELHPSSLPGALRGRASAAEHG